MNKEYFLQKLEQELYFLNAADRQDALYYYAEYFDEAGPENEKAICEELGSPEALAKQIKEQFALRDAQASSGTAFPQDDFFVDQQSGETFNAVYINTATLKVSLIPSNHFGMEYSLGKATKLKRAEIVNQILYFETKERFFFFHIPSKDEYLNIYYPAETNFSIVDIRTISGSIAFANFNADQLNIHSTSGLQQGGNLSANTCNASSVSGKISLDTLSVGECSLSASSGSLSLQNAEIAGLCNMKCISGKMRISQVSASQLCFKNTSGSVKMENCSFGLVSGSNISGCVAGRNLRANGITVQTTSGTQQYDGELFGNNSLSAVSGSVKFKTTASITDFSCSLSSASGSKRINDEKSAGFLNPSASNRISVNTVSGSIKLNFRK